MQNVIEGRRFEVDVKGKEGRILIVYYNSRHLFEGNIRIFRQKGKRVDFVFNGADCCYELRKIRYENVIVRRRKQADFPMKEQENSNKVWGSQRKLILALMS